MYFSLNHRTEVGSIRLRSFIRDERAKEKLWQQKRYCEVVSGSRLQKHKGFRVS